MVERELAGVLQTAPLNESGYRLGNTEESAGIFARQTAFSPAKVPDRVEALAIRRGISTLRVEFVLPLSRVLFVALQTIVCRSVHGSAFWVSAQNPGRTLE
jgi:hypothetical protein